MNVSIKSGVKIGTGAIIDTGSIVTKDVEPYSIMGNTAKLIKFRFEKSDVQKLLESKLWMMNEDELRVIENNIDEFIKS